MPRNVSSTRRRAPRRALNAAAVSANIGNMRGGKLEYAQQVYVLVFYVIKHDHHTGEPGDCRKEMAAAHLSVSLTTNQ